ncbi:MAG: hypothetical protein WC700_04040 [Gemmatimonadaceae bacterium]|jgi:hypothetical protein
MEPTAAALTKVFDTTIVVRNPVNFCADKKRHLMTELQRIYGGRCFKGAFIVNVVEILKSSSCRLETTNTSGNGTVDVQFLAAVVVFSRWDILVGVEIRNHQSMVIGEYGSAASGRAVVSILASRAAETLAIKQRVPVRVIEAHHQPMQESAAIIATLLTCDQAAPVYSLRGGLDASDRLELGPVLAAIDAELDARTELVAANRASVWFFEELLCAYQRKPGGGAAALARIPSGGGAAEWVGPAAVEADEAGTEARNALELVRRALAGEAVPVAGVWSRSLALYRSSPLVTFAETQPKGWPMAVDSTPRIVFAEFLKNILDFLVAIRELLAVYDTPEKVEAHRNVWAVMRGAQKLR